jgi:hypothetical protein
LITALMYEGFLALRDARGTATWRGANGLERAEFVNCMIIGGVVTIIGLIVPELSGMSAINDRALGGEPTDLMLTWPMFPALTITVALMTMVVIWRGPLVTAWIARGFGAAPTPMQAAIWLYLATAASIVVSLVLSASDLFFGLASDWLPGGIAYLSLLMSLLGLVALLAVMAVLAQRVLALDGPWRGILFSAAWSVLVLVATLALLAVLHTMLGEGASS